MAEWHHLMDGIILFCSLTLSTSNTHPLAISTIESCPFNLKLSCSLAQTLALLHHTLVLSTSNSHCLYLKLSPCRPQTLSLSTSNLINNFSSSTCNYLHMKAERVRRMVRIVQQYGLTMRSKWRDSKDSISKMVRVWSWKGEYRGVRQQGSNGQKLRIVGQ